MGELRLREVCQTHSICQRHERGLWARQWQVPGKVGWRVGASEPGMEGDGQQRNGEVRGLRKGTLTAPWERG